MTVTRDAAHNLNQLRAMTDELDLFLAGGAPYREVLLPAPGGGWQTGTMSVGLMVDLVQALEHEEAALPPGSRQELAAAQARLDAARRRAAYGHLLARELHGQMDAWRYYLDECQTGEAGCASAYPAESRKRTRIDQLLREADRAGLDVRAERDRVAALDRRLRALFVAGPYVGPEATDWYRPEEHWWLFGRVKPDGAGSHAGA
jgi:hypothetical protein